MKFFAILFCTVTFFGDPAFANDSSQKQCEAQAVSKKLAGAAKTSFIGKCVKDISSAKKSQCEQTATDKKLYGAARNSFVQKCIKTDLAVDAITQCEKTATDKKLYGAAKNSFVKKCVQA